MLELKALYKAFSQAEGDPVQALDGLSLCVRPGQFVVIIGSHGAGKSVLLDAIAGRVRLDSGTIRIAGRDVTGEYEHERAACVAYVGQSPLAGTGQSLTVAENLRLGSIRGTSESFTLELSPRERDRYMALLARCKMGIEWKLDSRAGVLTACQRQAVTLLMATLRRPEILLLDNHTADLDRHGAGQIALLTRQVVREQKLTTLMVTDDVKEALEVGDRTILLHRGQVALDLEGAERDRMRPARLAERFKQFCAGPAPDRGMTQPARA